ncbi:MAG: type 1 glutamine amidotransferase [Candidatus Omnitrophota bacterium]
MSKEERWASGISVKNMLIIIKHIDIEGPGTAQAFWERAAVPMEIVELHKGRHLPTDISQAEGVIVLGGPMNVYQEKEFPFLKEENDFLIKAIKQNVPLLGICLGAQLIAKASGAKVRKSPVQETGWREVFLTDEGRGDEIFCGLDSPWPVFQWHEDTFDVPRGGSLLATGKECAHQAFKVGACAYGFQFHIEITEGDIRRWCSAYLKEEEGEEKCRAMVLDYSRQEERYHQQANQLYRNFSRIISSRKVLAG